MNKRTFQGLKRTFMHVLNLPLPCFDFKKKNNLKSNWFFLNQNMVEEDLRHE